MRRPLLGAVALAAGTVGGAVLGYLAERTVVEPAAEPEPEHDVAGVEQHDVVSVDGTRLAVQASGPLDAPRILLVHGMSLTHEIWEAQRRELDGRYRVVTVDLRGHGNSDDAVSGDYSAEALGADVCAVIAALAAWPVVVVGHSMGGVAVLSALTARRDPVTPKGRPDAAAPDGVDAAATAPETLQIAGVVLINTALSAVISGLRGGTVAAGIAFVRERARSTRAGRIIYGGLDASGLPRGNDLATLVTRTLGVGADAPEEAVRKVRRLVLDSRPHVAGEMWRTAGMLDQIEAARQLTAPMLIIAGGRDRVLPVHHSRRLATMAADAELVELEGVGHVAMLERPAEVTSLIDGFVRRVLDAASGYGAAQHRAKG
jgi:pimeloyl-ACP methyl ester carboxylesterase